MSEKIVQLNEEVIKGQIKELVRGSVEEMLTTWQKAEALSSVPWNNCQCARWLLMPRKALYWAETFDT